MKRIKRTAAAVAVAGVLIVAGASDASAGGWVRHWDCYWRNLHLGTSSVSLASQLSYQGWSCYSNQVFVP